MRKLFLFVSLVFTGCLQLQAQRELLNPLIDSKIILTKGAELHNEGKYKAAIAEYLKVPASDTSYSNALHDLILSYYSDSNFVEAERYSHIALELYPDQRIKWVGFLADVYDDTKRTDLALQAYDTILAQNPYNHLAYFNKAITLFRQKRYDEATTNFQQCIIINPYYTAAHYFLGQLAMLKGNMVEAMLSFSANLLISPSNRYNKNSIGFLQTIAEVNSTATEYLQKYKAGKNDDFEEIQEILTSKASLDKKYKLKADLEDPIVRQLQVVVEKLEYNALDKGFWMQYYVPLFKNLWDNNYFEPMVMNMFSELDIKKVKEYKNKEKKKIGAFSIYAANYLNQIRESHELNLTKREKSLPRYYIKDYLVQGKGQYAKTAKNEDVVTGPWEFYYENGHIKSKGNFVNEGNRNGNWQYNYDNGITKEVTEYADDKANGKSRGWSDNGLLSSTSTYANDKTEGIETIWYYSGRLFSVINYKAGKKEGVAKYYNIDDYLKTVTHYVNDQQQGEETIYHANGKIESVVNYTADKANGEYKEYFDNGKLKTKGNFTEGKKTGVWNSYYIDGKPNLQENYIKGELDGEWFSYYNNGKFASKRFYKKGEADGKTEDFDDDGIVFSETIFERGRLRDIKFFDKKGEVISNTTSRKGNADITFYTADGSRSSQGYYSKDGLAEGDFNYYYKNGKISAKGFYKNGLREGKKTFYHPNGKLMQEGVYQDDKTNGYFVNYYLNGQVSSEGWYVDDLRQGTFIYYDLLGKITSRYYYLNDKVHGVSEYFTPSTKPDYKQYYHKGWFNKIQQYDSSGKIMLTSLLNKGEGKVRFNHFNGKPYFESNYKYYQLHGAYTVTNGDGSKRSIYYYKNGELDSNYITWYPNGKIQAEGKYEVGKKTGTWKYYSYDGKLIETENYSDGALDGQDIEYNEQGTISKEVSYKKGELDGEVKYYGDNAELMLVFYYKNDDLKGYSYNDKAGKLLPMIPLKKGAGTVDSYYKNGQKSVHIIFNEGVADGDRLFYFTNGKEMSVGSRINGLDNGSYKTYYPSGKIMKEENYYYGDRHGPFKYYNENGTLIYEVNYYLGNMHGDCKYYTAGKITQTYTYYYGILELKK